MKALFNKHGFTIFLVAAAVHVLAIGFQVETLRFYTKPLLIPLLALTVYFSVHPGKERSIFLAALIFSFFGDVLLMFEHINSLYFIFGLVSFLLAHVLYIIFFAGIKKPGQAFRWKPLVILLILGYGLSLLILLWPRLNELKIPVALYALVICCMLISSLIIQHLVNNSAAAFFLSGALFFVTSDSILAYNKFYEPFSAAPVLIMLTYCAAQYLLSKGFVSYKLSSTRTSTQ